MSFGAGWGTAFGGKPVVPLDSPVADIGSSQPVTFDFTDDIDGPLPGSWDRLLLETDAGGGKVGIPDPDPDLYFKVAGGRGWWRYTRNPTVPGPGVAFDEHGYAASPGGIIVSRNAEIGVAFEPPTKLLDPRADSFVLEVMIGLRANDQATSFIAARTRASWAAGAWSPAVALEIVSAAGAAPTVVASAVFDSFNDPADIWRAAELAELVAHVRSGVFTASLNGIAAQVSAGVANGIGSKPFIFVKVYNLYGAILESPAIVAGIRLRSLRDFERPGPAPSIEGDASQIAPQLPMVRLPLRGLLEAGHMKRLSARAFEFVREVEVDVCGTKNLFRVGERLNSVEPYVGQELTRVYADLAAIRAQRQRGL